MKQVWAERSKPEELTEISEWLYRIADRNLIDPDVLDYPATALLKSTDGERNLLHVPVQTVYMIESLGISPKNTMLDTAKALYALFTVVRWESKKAGIGEVYFQCRDEQTVKFAMHNGMEQTTIPLFKLKVGK